MMASSSSGSPPPPPLQLAPMDEGDVAFGRLRALHVEQLARALDEIQGIDNDQPSDVDHSGGLTLVLPHRLTTLLTHVFPRGFGADAGLGPRVGACVALTEDLARVPPGRPVVYLAPPTVDDARAIATHAALLESRETTAADVVPWRFCVVPTGGAWTTMCAEALAHQGLRTPIEVLAQPVLGFVPIDADLATLGRERCLADAWLRGDNSALGDVAAALQQLQELYGRFENVKYKGDAAAIVFHELMTREQQRAAGAMREGTEPKPATKKRRKLDTLVILDRRVDFASALVTPLTLEALVDELFEARDGVATIPTASSPSASTSDGIFALNAGDRVYADVRDRNVQGLGRRLQEHAATMQRAFGTFRETSAAASVTELHDFVKTVPQIKSQQEALERLVDVVELVLATTDDAAFRSRWRLERLIMGPGRGDLVDTENDDDAEDELAGAIEELIFRHAPLLGVLRLLCLWSVVRDGLARRHLERLQLHVVRAYGHELVFALEALDRVGLLRLRDRSRHRRAPFRVVAAALDAVQVRVDVENPGHPAFVTSGYAPISCRLIEALLRDGTWETPTGPPLHVLEGQRGEVQRRTLAKPRARSPQQEPEPRPSATAAKARGGRRKTMVLCFVGGVTYVEIATLRWLAQFYHHDLRIVASSVINGNSFLTDLLPRLPATT